MGDNPFAIVKETVLIEEYIGKYVELKKTGETYQGKCPFHDDREPSFAVYPDSKKWKCFGECDESGDIFDFAVKKGIAADDVDACRIIAHEYNIPIEINQPPKYFAPDVQVIKKAVTEYAHEMLMKNVEALTYLSGRGFTPEILNKWKIGISDGKIYQHFREIFKEKDGQTPLYDILVSSGIAEMKEGGEIYEFIRDNMLMYPVYVKRNTSHWDLRECNDEKTYKYQIPKVKREEGLFFNQNQFDKKEIWIVEGRDDVIFMEELAKKNTVGLFGSSVSQEQIEYIKSLVMYDDNVPQKSINKVFHLLLDGDSAGYKAASKLANELCDFFNVFVYELPKDEDPHSYLIKGGKIGDLRQRPVTKSESRVHEVNGQYIYEGEAKSIITDFTMNVVYEIEDEKKEKRYLISIYQDGNTNNNLYDFNSDDWTNVNSFRKWIGSKGGKFNFYGTDRQLVEMKRYLFDHSATKNIKVFDGHGEIEPGIRVFDNGVIYKGKKYSTDSNGITWVNSGDYQGVKTISHGIGRQMNICEEPYSLDDILKNLFEFYPKDLVWYAIGFATATIYFRTIANHFSFFPLLFCVGPHGRGKTFYADIIQSLTGGSGIPSPGQKSTATGIERLANRCYNFPIILNEYKGMDREELARAWFNLDPRVRARTTNDAQIHDLQYHSSGIFTNLFLTKEEDIISRLIIIDFTTIVPDSSKVDSFNEYWLHGVSEGRNIGLLTALLQTDCDSNIIDCIKKVQKILQGSDRIKDARSLCTISIIAGSFAAAIKNLKIGDILKKHGLPQLDQENVVFSFTELSIQGEKEKKSESLLVKFFEYMFSLYIDNKLASCLRFTREPDCDMIAFNPGKVLHEIKGYSMRMQDDTFKKISPSDIGKLLSVNFVCEKKQSSIKGNKMYCLLIPVESVEEKTGIKFDEKEGGFVNDHDRKDW